MKHLDQVTIAHPPGHKAAEDRRCCVPDHQEIFMAPFVRPAVLAATFITWPGRPEPPPWPTAWRWPHCSRWAACSLCSADPAGNRFRALARSALCQDQAGSTSFLSRAAAETAIVHNASFAAQMITVQSHL